MLPPLFLERITKIVSITKDMGPTISIIAIIGGAVSYAHATFSTLSYVDQKHESVMGVVGDLQKTQRATYRLLVELARDQGIKVKPNKDDDKD